MSEVEFQGRVLTHHSNDLKLVPEMVGKGGHSGTSEKGKQRNKHVELRKNTKWLVFASNLPKVTQKRPQGSTGKMMGRISRLQA